ncbi:MAG TPA: hypothetical protein VF096_00680 [Azonexus sp.]
MNWQGIDWVVAAFELAMLGLSVMAFITCIRGFRHGRLSRFGALWRYSLLLLLAIAGYVLFCALWLGIEGFYAVRLVSEELLRSFFAVVGMGGALWLAATVILGITLLLVKRQPGTEHSRP